MAAALRIAPLETFAAAPRVIVVEGDLLGTPVLLRDWTENLELVQAIDGGGSAVASGDASDPSRPRLDLLFFWLADPAVTSVSQLGPSEARIPFWPAVGDEPARVGMGQVADARVIEILSRHGVPTRIEDGGGGSAGRGFGATTGVIGVVAVALALMTTWIAVRRRDASRGGV